MNKRIVDKISTPTPTPEVSTPIPTPIPELELNPTPTPTPELTPTLHTGYSTVLHFTHLFVNTYIKWCSTAYYHNKGVIEFF